MHNNDSEIQLNVALVPEEKIQQQAIQLSQILRQQFDTHFVLNQKDILPHITISQARYPKHNLDKVINLIKQQTKSLPDTSLELNQFCLILHQYIFWNLKRTPEIFSFHNRIIEATNPLREGLVIKHIAEVKNLSPQDESDRQKFGALLIGPRFQPHITLTRFKNEMKITDITKSIGENKFATTTFHKSKLVIGYLGDHGTITSIIEQIPLH